MQMKSYVLRRISNFVACESGTLTPFAMMLVLCSVFVGGIAIDASRLQTTTVLMQNAADSSAISALQMRSRGTSAAAVTEAIKTAEAVMPPGIYGAALRSTDVEFGTWNTLKRTFTPSATALGAVRVTIRLTTAGANPFRTTVTRLLGIESWDVVRSAVLVDFDPGCLREGFVSEYMVDIQSNNYFKAGFCIHSNTTVKISSGSTFEPGVSVSMPTMNDLLLPSSGYASNPGLREAVETDRYNLGILTQMSGMIAGLTTPGSRYIPAYITNQTPITLGTRNIGTTTLTAGRIYRSTCTGNQSLSIGNNVVLRNVVIVTNCKVSFGQGAMMENSMMATTNTDTRSINGPSNVSVGKNDACATGGGAQILTLGGMSFASDFRIFGGQLLARGDVAFSAAGDGVEGVSIVAGGTISGTSNMTMANCNGAGMEQNLRVTYTRLVM